tara:strand:+ start:8902 stop:9279 length:378 start_codon:yes stop_codon:yes gene_type:complete
MKNLLVVDDDEMLRQLITSQFEILGITRLINVSEFENGLEALNHIRDNKKEDIDLLITDLKMPEMEGNDLIGHIMREGLPKPKTIIVISGYMVKDQNINLEGVYFLNKPFDMNYFRSLVKERLGV